MNGTDNVRWAVRCWPVGEGEDDGEGYGEPEFFDTLERALLRGVEEVAEWAESHASIAEDGDMPHDAIFPGLSQAITEIRRAAASWNYDLNGTVDDSRFELRGTASNDVVVITKEQA